MSGRLQAASSGDGASRYVVRLLYVSRECGYGLKLGRNAQNQPIVDGFLGDAAQRAGVSVGSVITSVDGVAVSTLQELAAMLQAREKAAAADAAVEFGLLAPAPAAAAAPPAGSGGDLLALVATSPQPAAPSEDKIDGITRISSQINAVCGEAEKHMLALNKLRAALASADSADKEVREAVKNTQVQSGLGLDW